MTAVALHHAEYGRADGPPLLLAGSLGTRLAMWQPQLDRLGATRRLVAVDHRGHGDSPVPPGPYAIADLGGDLIALLDRLEIERVDFCGLSIGGMVGQWLAINAPERIGRLVLICTASDIPNGDAFRARADAVRQAQSTATVADAVVVNWFTDGWRGEHGDAVAHYREMIAQTPVEVYAGCCEAVAGHDVHAGLGRVRAPTLVIGGAQDRAIPVTQSERIAVAIPEARLEILDPAAHLASVERADAVGQMILEHLDV